MKEKGNHQVVQETDGTTYDGRSYHNVVVIEKNLSLESAQSLADSHKQSFDSGLRTNWIVRGCSNGL